MRFNSKTYQIADAIRQGTKSGEVVYDCDLEESLEMRRGTLRRHIAALQSVGLVEVLEKKTVWILSAVGELDTDHDLSDLLGSFNTGLAKVTKLAKVLDNDQAKAYYGIKGVSSKSPAGLVRKAASEAILHWLEKSHEAYEGSMENDPMCEEFEGFALSARDIWVRIVVLTHFKSFGNSVEAE